MTVRNLSKRLGALAAAALLSTAVEAQPQLGHHPATADAARRYYESLHDRTPAPRLWVPTRATACPCTCTCPEPAKPVSADERPNR